VRAGRTTQRGASPSSAEQGAGCRPAAPGLGGGGGAGRAVAGEGDQRARADALRRAAETYAAAGQLLNERRARETLERRSAEVSS
jgi:hypothetical protein